MTVHIQASRLSMSYRIAEREAGLFASLQALLRPSYRQIEAVQSVSFNIEEGELVAFLGPNGAGKTTVLKLLSGVLHPVSGNATVLGYVPWKRPREYLKKLAMIRGSRPLAVPGELTVMDTLRFQQRIYEVDDTSFQRQLAELNEMLQLEPLLGRQARVLSLGEKMRAGLACSLIYRPQVLFLDEPTIGLDVSAIAEMRRFIAHYNAVTRSTIVLTSHYMADVKSLCRRVILIDKGALTFDGPLKKLEDKWTTHKIIRIPAGTLPPGAFAEDGAVEEERSLDGSMTLRIPKENSGTVAAILLTQYGIGDFTVEEPSLEFVMDRIYREGAAL